MRDGRAGLGHPPWQGGGGGQAEACLHKGLNALRLDASANYHYPSLIILIHLQYTLFSPPPCSDYGPKLHKSR